MNMWLRKRVSGLEDAEGGFTLIELLVVITILGILAAIVVFSVGGLGDKGQASACKTDTSTLVTAEEASLAGTPNGNSTNLGNYTDMQSLVNDGLLTAPSTLHEIVANTPTDPATPTGPTSWQPNTSPQGYAIYTINASGGTPVCDTTAGGGSILVYPTSPTSTAGAN